MDKYYQQSEDNHLAFKLMKLGQSLAVHLTDEDDITTLSVIQFTDRGMLVGGELQEGITTFEEFESYCKQKIAQFILPIANSNIEDRDRKIKDLQSEVNGLKCAAQRDRSQSAADKAQHVLNLQYIVEIISQHQNTDQIKRLCNSINQCLDALKQ